MTRSQSIEGKLTTGEVALVVDQNLFSFNRGDFSVHSVNAAGADSIAYIVRGKTLSLRNRMLVMDPTERKIALVQKYLMALHSTYIIYRYTPNKVGQESTETDDDGVPVYRFAQVIKSWFSWTDKFYYTMYDGNDDESEHLFQGEADFWSFTLQMDVTRVGDSSGLVLADIGKSTWLHLVGDSTWVVEVGPGMDALGMLCYTLATNAILEDEAQAEKSNR
jgi:uncharacterized protein YxjI